jgi:ERCC4-type nuclease
VDTREQQPWTFGGIVIGKTQFIVPREVMTLDTGDYAIKRCGPQCIIERKSAEDLVGSVCAGHQRFEREHERMTAIIADGGQACVIVEGCLATILRELESDGRHAAKSTLMGCVTSWPFRFRVPWLFAGDRRTAEVLALQVMVKWWNSHTLEDSRGTHRKSEMTEKLTLFD